MTCGLTAGSAAWLEQTPDGETVHKRAGHGHEVAIDWRDEGCPPGVHWYYLHVRFTDTHPGTDWTQPMPVQWNLKPVVGIDAWSSPVFVEQLV